LKAQVHRSPVRPLVPFSAPPDIQFGYQPSRNQFSFWFLSTGNAGPLLLYIIVPTGVDIESFLQNPNGKKQMKPHKLLQSIITSVDEVYHLVQLAIE
jgi:hypothetical protein